MRWIPSDQRGLNRSHVPGINGMSTKNSEARACGAEAEQSSYGQSKLVIITGEWEQGVGASEV